MFFYRRKPLLIGLTVGLVLAVAVPNSYSDRGSRVSADINEGYTPPQDRGRIQRTEAGGSRGCDDSLDASFGLISPKDHVATTVSGRPTFLWHVSEVPSVPVRFTLVEPGVSKPLLETRVKVTRPGIVQQKIPPTVQELRVGREYKWTISLICNQKMPSQNPYAWAKIKRVTTSPELAKKIARASSSGDLALIYAHAGVWYEAVLSSFKAFQDKPRDRSILINFQSLLGDVGLNDIAEEQMLIRTSVSQSSTPPPRKNARYDRTKTKTR